MFEFEMTPWQGRVDAADGPLAVRWHEWVKPLTADSAPGLASVH